MNAVVYCTMVGFMLLALTYVVDFLVTDKAKALVTKLILAVLATGMFTANVVYVCMK